MDTFLPALPPHPTGEQPSVEEFSATAETFAGRVHVEWDPRGQVTPLGQLPFFIEYLEAGRTVRRLGGGLSVDVQQPERPVQTRSAGHSVTVCAVGALPLHHDAAV